MAPRPADSPVEGTPVEDEPPAEDPTPGWCRAALRWSARLSAVTAVVLFALVLIAIHQERLLHDSTATVVATFRLNNGYFDDRVDFTQPGRIRDETLELRRTLDEIDAATTEDVRLLESIVPDTARLLAAANTDLEIAHQLTGIADTLRTTAGDIARSAEHADATVTSVDARLATVADLVERLNRRLADIDRKLVRPRAPGPPAGGESPAHPLPDPDEVLPR